MATWNDGFYPSPDKLKDSNNCGQQQSYHRNDLEYPIMAPPAYDIAILSPEMENPNQEGSKYNRSNAGETLTMDEAISNKMDMYENKFPEDSESLGFGFSDASIRQGFIRKVYLILTVQLLITAGIISIFVFYKPAAALARSRLWIVIIVFAIVLFFAIICSGDLRRKAPTNYILLGLFTVTKSLVLGIISTKYRGDIVLMAMGMTAVICLGLTLFAFQTKLDFTFCGSFLFIAFLLLLIFGITAVILHNNGEKKQILYLLYASVGAIIFSIYLISDTQIMMAGNHKYSLSPEEYIFAALNLYIDVIQIFIYLLRILRYLDFSG